MAAKFVLSVRGWHGWFNLYYSKFWGCCQEIIFVDVISLGKEKAGIAPA